MKSKAELLARIDELSAKLGLECDVLRDEKCFERLNEIIREYEKVLRSGPIFLIDEALKAIEALSELSKDDWKVIKRLLALSITGEALITRATDIATHRNTIRDEISKQLSRKEDGPIGTLAELGLIDRSPLTFDAKRKRWVRWNWLSPVFFELCKRIADVKEWYFRYREVYEKLNMALELKQRIEQFKRRYRVDGEKRVA